MNVKENYASILKEIYQTALSCGRNPDEISLVAVTKNEEWQRICPIYDSGQRAFGESRLQEALQKKSAAPIDCQWHFIGTLQKNKVRKVVGNFALIHSVDTLDLAAKISLCSQELGVITHILLQSNMSGEHTKHGQTADKWVSCFNELLALPYLSIDGLMTMAPLVEEEQEIRSCFAGLKKLRDGLSVLAKGKADLRHLSMGMTHDFKLAIAEGATLLRIGSGIFSNAQLNEYSV